MNVFDVKDAQDAVRAAEARLHEAIQRAFPVGRFVSWEHSNHVRRGHVAGHSLDRLLIRGRGNGLYWIHASRVVAHESRGRVRPTQQKATQPDAPEPAA